MAVKIVRQLIEEVHFTSIPTARALFSQDGSCD